MANFPNSISISKIQQRLSRRAFVRQMAVGAALVAVPTAAIPAPVLSPRKRLAALIEEAKLVAKEIFPTIEDRWTIHVAEDGESNGCPFVVIAFEKRKRSRRSVKWRGLDQLDPVQS